MRSKFQQVVGNEVADLAKLCYACSSLVMLYDFVFGETAIPLFG